jgi:hypothetical protein
MKECQKTARDSEDSKEHESKDSELEDHQVNTQLDKPDLQNNANNRDFASDNSHDIEAKELGNVMGKGDKNYVINDLVTESRNIKDSMPECEIASENSVFPDGYVPISATKLRGAFDDDEWTPSASKEDDFIDTCGSLPVESNVIIGKLIDISNDEVIAEQDEELPSPEPEEKVIPEIYLEGKTEAVCVQRSEIRPALTDIKKVQAIALLSLDKRIIWEIRYNF